jgi:ABC-2 type transport system ATP-binding protein
MITFQRLVVDYSCRRANDHLSFHAEKGDILGLLYPKGADEISTLGMLTRIMRPTPKPPRFSGFEVFNQSLEGCNRTGHVPESLFLNPNPKGLSMVDPNHLCDDPHKRVETEPV